VQAAAVAVAEATDELSLSVARAVTRTAELVAETRLALDRAIEAEVIATASALAVRVLAAAHMAAIDADLRLGYATAAPQQAARLPRRT
jgi:ribose 1,5-bisphosphokinase PhnN